LDPLVKEDPKNPAYRYLLAQCYREEAGPDSGPLREIDKAEQLLKALVKDYPYVADYRFELADTYAMLDVRDLPPEDFPRAEQRLRAALEQSADLVDGHPYAPDYISLHIHILHKLARILRDTPPDRRDADVARMDEAGQLYQEAIRRQAALVKRFPENVAYRFWLATIRLSSAGFLLERRQPAEARKLLEAAVTETDQFYQAHQDATSLRPVLHGLYLRLSEARDRVEDDQGAREAKQKADKTRSAASTRTAGKMTVRPTAIGLRHEDRGARPLTAATDLAALKRFRQRCSGLVAKVVKKNDFPRDKKVRPALAAELPPGFTQPPRQVGRDQTGFRDRLGRQIACQPVKMSAQLGRLEWLHPLRQQRGNQTGEHVPGAAGCHPAVASGIDCHPTAVGDHALVPFQHEHEPMLGGKFHGEGLAILLHRRRIGRREPGKLARVRRQDSREDIVSPAFPGGERSRRRSQGIERVGVEYRRTGDRRK
jgi:hypothetical protein